MTTHNDYGGTYNIKISCQDDFNSAVVRNFEVLIIRNEPPLLIGQINDQREIVFTFF